MGRIGEKNLSNRQDIHGRAAPLVTTTKATIFFFPVKLYNTALQWGCKGFDGKAGDRVASQG